MRFTSLLRSASAAAALLLGTAFALAGEQPYDKAKFDAALAAGKPVIVDVQADWCPTCKQQKPIVQSLVQQPKLKDVTVFVADFDKETALKKRINVSMQSTFVVFKGGKEVGRSTGVTDKAALADLFSMAL